MSQCFHIHPENPQPRLIRQAVRILQDGGVIVYPTDSAYALGCHLGDKKALSRICQIRSLDEKHDFTLVCRDLSELATYAQVGDGAYRLLKANTPGSYTFLLKATKEVPRRLMHPKKKTIGMRVPDHPVALALLEELGEPMMTTTLILPGETLPMLDPEEIRPALERQVDLVIDSGFCGVEVTTVVDLLGQEPIVRREGKGDPAPFL